MIRVSISNPNIAETIRKKGEQVFQQVDAEIGASVQNMEDTSKKLVPKDRGNAGGLVSGISSGRGDKPALNWIFVCNKTYAAFVEFGTRSNVRIPAGLESFAAQFIGGEHSELDAKQAIFDWCKRHGIERRAWYAIFVKIMTLGVKPQPFFFPAFEQERPQLIQRLRQIL